MTWYVLALRLAGLGWYVALSIVFGVVGGLGQRWVLYWVPWSRFGDSIRWSNPS